MNATVSDNVLVNLFLFNCSMPPVNFIKKRTEIQMRFVFIGFYVDMIILLSLLDIAVG